MHCIEGELMKSIAQMVKETIITGFYFHELQLFYIRADCLNYWRKYDEYNHIEQQKNSLCFIHEHNSLI